MGREDAIVSKIVFFFNVLEKKEKKRSWGSPIHKLLDFSQGVSKNNNSTDSDSSLFQDQKYGRFNFQLFVLREIWHLNISDKLRYMDHRSVCEVCSPIRETTRVTEIDVEVDLPALLLPAR